MVYDSEYSGTKLFLEMLKTAPNKTANKRRFSTSLLEAQVDNVVWASFDNRLLAGIEKLYN